MMDFPPGDICAPCTVSDCMIEKRRSVRKYVERNTVTKDEILSMIKAAQEAPIPQLNATSLLLNNQFVKR